MRHVFLPAAVVASMLLPFAAHGMTDGTRTNPQAANLSPGDFVWQPQVSPAGPIVIVVDLSTQLLQVYRNGELIGRSTVGAGTGKHPTPTGIFTILEKDRTHHSTKYHEASMPYTERLTWGGVAIHAGNVLGKPDSHGCIHVPLEFARKLYNLDADGTTVLVTAGSNAQNASAQPDLEFSSGKPSPVTTPSVQIPDSWHPEAAPSGPMCVVYSSADRRIYVYRNRVEIGVSNVGLRGNAVPSVGDRVYAAEPPAAPDTLPMWKLLGSVEATPAPDARQILQQVGAPDDFLKKLNSVLSPGSTLVLTDQPVDKQAAKSARTALLDAENS